MKDAWPEVSLADVALDVTVGHVGSMADEYQPRGVPFLRSLNVEPFRINRNDLKFIGPAFHNRLRKSSLNPGDVVIVRTGKPGACAVVPDWLKEANCSDVVIVRAGPRIRPHYISYLVNSVAVSHVAAYTVGAVQQHFNVGSARQIRFRLPPLLEQDAIISVLGALDDKIDLNRRMNETLEAMARAIFKDWFVDFGPTKAMVEGRAPYLSADIWSLFPDRLDDEGKPEGWSRVPLKSLTSKIGSGATPRGGSSVYLDNGISLIRSQNVYDRNFDWSGLAHITDEDARKLNNVEVRADDVLMNITGDSILRTCVVDTDILPARVNQHVAIIRAENSISARYLHEYLVRGSTKAALLGNDAGGSRAAITKGHLEALLILRPSANLMHAFDGATGPLYGMAALHRREQRTLAATRDLLLPKLMSGEVRVQDVAAELVAA